MKIFGPGQIQSKSIQKTSRRRSADGSSFASELDETSHASSAASTRGASPIASLDVLLSVQEVPDATVGRSKGLKRADEMLDMLEEVRRGLLLGAIPEGNLRTLADLARNQRGRIADPKLAEILGDIELRAEVELAKLGY
ncbi:flagellar assembly protein FliX [Pseudokordiimonas caeni]|uniref:flagellar assembly protein FliX n=1 Tax=Pseudokordiimonas caeni TaxID=2997908 RepID=UPI0028124E36|nr:flagellar assembly protein FliX [Pseudokordiimonas caeni]